MTIRSVPGTEVPMPTFPSATNVVDTVATPTVRSAISTSAVCVSDVAVVAVPVKLPVTSPVIPPIKLDAATAFAVKIPTIMFGVPLKLNAVDAVPVTSPTRSPVTFPVISPVNDVAVITPVNIKSDGNLSLGTTGSLSVPIVP